MLHMYTDYSRTSTASCLHFSLQDRYTNDQLTATDSEYLKKSKLNLSNSTDINLLPRL